MNILHSTLKQKFNSMQRGQSLVETALIMPILLLMFLGVIEVGWALRGYLALSTMNRESVRFAVKNGVLDYSIKDPTTIGYDEVLSHTIDSLAEQLPLDFSGGPETNVTLIMSHLVVDTGYPCVKYAGGNPVVPYEFDDVNCDCINGDPTDPDGDGTPWFGRDDLILHPDSPGYGHYVQVYGINANTRIGKGSYLTEIQKLMLDDNQLNCTVLQTAGTAAELSANNMFVAETFYEQPQLLGVPFMSNKFTDPIPLYTHTAMRIVTSREASTHDTIGPVCELYPLAFNKQYFVDRGLPDPDVITNTVESVVLVENSAGSDDFDWVAWNPAQNASNDYLVEALINPRLAINDFVDLNDGDLILSTNEVDRVATATNFGGAQIGDQMDELDNKTIQLPVLDNAGNFDHVALLQVTNVVTLGVRTIEGAILGYNDQACEQ